MQKAGDVSFCDAHRHASGQGHCEFETKEGMEKAIDELDGRELHGRRIKLREDRYRICCVMFDSRGQREVGLKF